MGCALVAGMIETPPLLVDVARECRAILEGAESAGVIIDDGNIVDLIADHLTTIPLDCIRDALVIAGLATRFPEATRRHHGN